MRKPRNGFIAVLSSIALVAAVAMLGPLGSNAIGSWGSANGNGTGRGESDIARYTDDIFDYGVCRGVDPKCYHDWNVGFKNDGVTRILVYTHTAGPRHRFLGTELGEGLNPPLNDDNIAQQSMIDWGAENGWEVDWTEDPSQLGRLKNNYDAVIFQSPTRDTLDDAAQTNLRQYIRAGGGFVGIHNAFGTEYNWPWYEGLLGGANYYDHGSNQPGVVETVDRRDASTSFMPKRWDFKDEWYNLEPTPSFVRVLLEVDEDTLAPRNSGHPGHGKHHPVSWCQYYDGGRAFLTTLGHANELYNDEDIEGKEYFKQHVVNGIKSVIGEVPFCR